MYIVLVNIMLFQLLLYPIYRSFFAGRTGRAGKMGVAITFLTNDDDEVM